MAHPSKSQERDTVNPQNTDNPQTNNPPTDNPKREYAVAIAGGGPTGLMLASELALAGVDAVLIEKRPTQELDGSRAGGLLTRTLEVLDQRGIAERFISEGQVHAIQMSLVQAPLICDLPTRHNYVLALWQSHFERILAAWVAELGVEIRYGCEVVGFEQDETGIEIELSEGASIRAAYLVGCDGGRSRIRKAAGIEFPGWDATTSWMIAELDLEEEPEFGFRRDSAGTHAINRRAPGEPIRVVLTERNLEQTGSPGLEDLREALISVYGTDYGLRTAAWISRFTDMTRQAANYRKGRVLLAGDAAHIHPPQGGQGLNTGVQDAVNLGWKLAQVVKQISPDSLLDTYHAERHPVAARMLQTNMAMVTLAKPDDRHVALRNTMTELLSMEEPRKRIASMLSGLDIHYDLGHDDRVTHPLLGRRMPDLDLETAEGPLRVYNLLHAARPVLLNFNASGDFDLSPWQNRVMLIQASYGGVWELPVLGVVDAPPAVLIRPDGHVAWVGDFNDPALPEALTAWC